MSENRGTLTTIAIAAATAVVVTLATQATTETAAEHGGAVAWITGIARGLDEWVRDRLVVLLIVLLVPTAITLALWSWNWFSERAKGYGAMTIGDGLFAYAWTVFVILWAGSACLLVASLRWDGAFLTVGAVALGILGLARLGASMRNAILVG